MSTDREETLYHESARDLARMVVDLETTVEGLGHENTSLEAQLAESKGLVLELRDMVSQHQGRYKAAVAIIERRQRQINLQKQAYTRLAQLYSTMSVNVAKANESVRALKDVPADDLERAVGVVANLIDTALLH